MTRETRREFIRRGAVVGAALALGPADGRAATRKEKEDRPSATLPPRRGFNLVEKFNASRQEPYLERDFQWIASWKLDFVRLPMDYRSWTDPTDLEKLDDRVLTDIDQALEWGKEYGVHVNLNLHRAPGYCVNPPAEELDLWSSQKAQDAFVYQWRHFAERYRGIPSERLSFDLLNEPKDMDEALYTRVMRLAIEAIRDVDPNRLIVVDGLRWGRDPVHSLVSDRVAQSTRGYDPMQVSHYRASWVGGSDRWPEPTWPFGKGEQAWNRERYSSERIGPWKALEKKGVGIHVGEWGAYNRTPHAVALAWMADLLSLWRDAGWGWALWNLRGSFGVVDSERTDVVYEKLEGHDLDRRMLALLEDDTALQSVERRAR